MSGKLSLMPLATALAANNRLEGLVSGSSKAIELSLLSTYLADSFTGVARLRGDVTLPQFAGGAIGDGVVDDTDAIQAAVDWIYANGGGEVYLPAGRYKVTASIVFPGWAVTNDVNVSMRGEGIYNSVLDGSSITNSRIVYVGPPPATGFSQVGMFMRNFGIVGPVSENANINSIGLYTTNTKQLLVQDVDVFGCNYGMRFDYADTLVLYHCHAREARTFNCYLLGNGTNNGVGYTIHNCLFQVGDPSGNAFSEPSNIFVNAARNVLISGCLIDELGLNMAVGGSSVQFVGASDCEIHRSVIYAPGAAGGANPYYGVHIDSTSKRIALRSVRVEPYSVSPERVASNTIKIDAGAEDCILDNVSTYNPGGADISDSGTRTIYRDVNGHTKMVGDLKRSYQAPAYAATVTPDATVGDYIKIGALTGNLTVGAPTNPAVGQELSFMLLQDGTGGRTVTWNAAFIHSWSDTGNTANKRSSVRFVYNGTDWEQVGAQRAWA